MGWRWEQNSGDGDEVHGNVSLEIGWGLGIMFIPVPLFSVNVCQ